MNLESDTPANFDENHRPGPTEEESLRQEEGHGRTAQSQGTSPPAAHVSPPTPERAAHAAGRIGMVKTFYAPCNTHAIETLEQRIIKFLRDNPNVNVKKIKTNTADIDARPHLIVWLWY